jgi:hypothetical protein
VNLVVPSDSGRPLFAQVSTGFGHGAACRNRTDDLFLGGLSVLLRLISAGLSANRTGLLHG